MGPIGCGDPEKTHERSINAGLAYVSQLKIESRRRAHQRRLVKISVQVTGFTLDINSKLVIVPSLYRSNLNENGSIGDNASGEAVLAATSACLSDGKGGPGWLRKRS
jgi:hypothetical protein